MHQLETQNIRTPVDGILRYAAPLLRVEPWPPLKAAKEAVMSRLRSCERRLLQNPQQAETYSREIQKLIDAGYVKKLSSSEVKDVPEAWYIPHHIVHHNSKDRIVWLFLLLLKSMSEFTVTSWTNPWAFPPLEFCSVSGSIELQSVETLNQCFTRCTCYLRINLSCDSSGVTWTAKRLQRCMNGKFSPLARPQALAVLFTSSKGSSRTHKQMSTLPIPYTTASTWITVYKVFLP